MAQQLAVASADSRHPSVPRNPTLLLLAIGLGLPNVLSLGALLAGIGMPPRTTAILAYATLAVVARRVPPLVLALLALAVAAYDVISTVALLFNLAPSEIGLALHLSSKLKLLESPFYMMMAAAVVSVVGAHVSVLVLKREFLRHGNAMVLMGGAALFAVVDFVTNTSAHYQFGTLYAAGQPMESGAAESGFRKAILAGGARRILLVNVEALGRFEDRGHEALLLKPFFKPELRKRYDVKVGHTTYFGSTTAAEMRELCHTREPYGVLLEGERLGCLPERLKARGYETVAMHNFTSAFFGRDRWYPRLGFNRQIFGPSLASKGLRQCGGPFKGPCDKELVPLIANELRDAKRPTFFYWMTLSTHVPVAPREGTPRLDCERGGGAVGHAEVCHMTELWLDLFEELVALALHVPGTEILIVGDHAPPLWSKAGRELFTPGQVTWVRLVPRRRLLDSFRLSKLM